MAKNESEDKLIAKIQKAASDGWVKPYIAEHYKTTIEFVNQHTKGIKPRPVKPLDIPRELAREWDCVRFRILLSGRMRGF